MGLFDSKEKKKQRHEELQRQIDKANFEAMCRAGDLSEEEGRKLVEENINNGKPKFSLSNEENRRREPIVKEDKVCCPKCGCTQLSANKKGVGLGKAAVGAFVAGPYGLVAGGIGKNKIIITCLKCGKQFKPGK